MQRMSEAAERIVRAAVRLFAEQGYDRTSIADIHSAVGLAPGSGALYKHFPSKEAVLRAGIDQFIEEGARGQDFIAHLPDEPEAALDMLARGVMESLSADQDLLRIVWRDLDPFPDLQQRVTQERIQPAFDVLGQWIEKGVERGRFEARDCRALAVVALNSLVQYRISGTLLGIAPGGISEERFIRAWQEFLLRALCTECEAGAIRTGAEVPTE